METTTIQISKDLQEKLEARKIFDRESYEEIIIDLLEDTMELSEETKEHLKQSEKDVKNGRVYTLEQIKKEFNLH